LLSVKVARMYTTNSPLRVEEISYPDPGPDEVLVKIKASGICFSDIHALKGEMLPTSLPLVLGHEGAGIVETYGPSVKGFDRGQPVIIDYVHSCGKCAYCTSGRDNLCVNLRLFGFDVNGSFAEYAVVPSRSLVKLSSNIPFEQGAILGCAVSTPYHAFKRADLKKDEMACIIGIGGVGYHAALLCKAMGADFVAVDISPEQLARARAIGAKLVVNSAHSDPVEEIRSFTNRDGVDVVFDYVGVPQTIRQALGMVKKGGIVILVGIAPGNLEIDSLGFLLREVELRASIDHTHSDIETVERLTAEGKLDLSRSITHRVSLNDINEGLRMLEKKVGNPIRIAVVQ
jgi:propanol-preferring alcohol dehydrogenase